MAAPLRSFTRVWVVACACALVSCGRSGLGDLDSADARVSVEDDAAASAVLSDAGAQEAVDSGVPVPVPVDAAVVPAPGLCPLAPPLPPGCPPTLPRAVGACTPSNGQCIYSVTGEVGPMLAIFECTLLQENLIGWREWDVPCARACLGDAGGLPLDAGMCALRETVPCVPPAGEGMQATLNDQIFETGCQHRDGAGGYTVRFDAQGCATQIAGGLFSDCDVAALSSKRFACAQSHPCATAVTLVK